MWHTLHQAGGVARDLYPPAPGTTASSMTRPVMTSAKHLTSDGRQLRRKSADSMGSMEKAHPIPETRSQRVPAALSLALVLGAGAYVALSRHFSALGLVLFFVSASVLLLLCWKPNKKAAAATGIIAVGAVIYALPLGVVVSSPTFGAGLMAIGVVIAALHL